MHTSRFISFTCSICVWYLQRMLFIMQLALSPLFAILFHLLWYLSEESDDKRVAQRRKTIPRYRKDEKHRGMCGWLSLFRFGRAREDLQDYSCVDSLHCALLVKIHQSKYHENINTCNFICKFHFYGLFIFNTLFSVNQY